MYNITSINEKETQWDVKKFYIPFKGDIVITANEIKVKSLEEEGKEEILKWEEGIADEFRERLNERKGVGYKAAEFAGGVA